MEKPGGGEPSILLNVLKKVIYSSWDKVSSSKFSINKS